MGYTGEKKRQYQREWLAARRAEWFKDKVCVDCGWDKELELDHIDPTVKITHNVWSWTASKREIELAKCEARCKDCHLERTIKQLTSAICGNSDTPYNKGCRCDKCRERKRQKNAKRYRPV